MTERGKKYLEAAKLVEKGKAYAPQEAVELVKKTARAAFDETVELHLTTMSDPKHTDQLIRGVVSLPHGLGKQVKILVFAQGEAAITAKDAGADYVGDDDLAKKIEDGWVDFDVAIATPDMMGRIGRLGRVLGRRGLMPNPRTGTVVQPQDLTRAIQEARKGRVEFRMDRTAIVHAPVGKVSFEPQRLLENIGALVETVVRARPAGIKGQFIKSAYLCATMGPSIQLELSSTLSLKVE